MDYVVTQGAADERTGRGWHAEVALNGVYEISRVLALAARLETKLGGVLGLLASYLDMRNGLIAILTPDGNPMMTIGSEADETTARNYFDELPERAIGSIVVTKMPLVVGDVATDPLFSDWLHGRLEATQANGEVCAFIGVPIKDRDRVIGTLTIERLWKRQSGARFDDEVRFLTMVGNLVGQAVRLYEALAQDRERLINENQRLEKALEGQTDFASPRGAAPARSATAPGQIVGDSPAIQAVLQKVKVVARTNTTVLLRGESGTGKELFAKLIHDMSARAGQAFVKLNCAALAESVLESELFGHEKGAFTGAVGSRKGRFELADGGTLFLDEIGEISAGFQAKLLRVLQEGEFERVGGSRTLKVDVRLICATNRRLEEAVAKGDFRADLYYRISVVPIFLPPLRDRPGDVTVLAREFVRRFNREHSTSLALDATALDVLTSCYFPGNVRELENCVRRTATFAHGSRITATDFACRNNECLSATLWPGGAGVAAAQPGFAPLPVVNVPRPAASRPLPSRPEPSMPLSESEDGEPLPARDKLIAAMQTAGWVQAKAARLLGLTPRQVGYALRKWNVDIKRL